MGIALFHLLPEASENFEEYFASSAEYAKWKKLPSAFFVAFMSYSLILFVEKIAFDSHSITEHDHGAHEHPEHHSHRTRPEQPHKGSDLSEPLLEKSENKPVHKPGFKLSVLEPIKESVNDKQEPGQENEDGDNIQTRPRENSKFSANSSIND